MTNLWQVNDRIAAEQFDAEIVLIDIEKGLYFSLTGAATDAWKMLSRPHGLDRVVEAFPVAHATEIAAALAAMQQHGLIVAALGTVKEGPPLDAILTFTAPGVEAFSDLAELITIDPVHEVDANAGWPLRPASFPEPK